jgi:hypothetical protein
MEIRQLAVDLPLSYAGAKETKKLLARSHTETLLGLLCCGYSFCPDFRKSEGVAD